MEDTITQQLDDKDMECVEVLERAGYGRCAAKVIVALVTGGKTQHELTVCTSENQSAVSVAVRKLKDAAVLDVSELGRTVGKGRPKHMYRLISWVAIVDMIERKAIREFEETNAQINKLKELTD